MARLEYRVVQAIELSDAATRDMVLGFGSATLTPTIDGWEARTLFSVAGWSGKMEILAGMVRGKITIGAATVADAVETTQAWLVEALPAGVRFDCDEHREPDYVMLVFTFKPSDAEQA